VGFGVARSSTLGDARASERGTSDKVNSHVFFCVSVIWEYDIVSTGIKSNMLMKCPDCGKEIARDALFCSSCGRKIERNKSIRKPESNNSSKYDSSNGEENGKKSSCLKTIIEDLLLGLLIIGVFRYCDEIKNVSDFVYKTITMSEEEKLRASIQEALEEMKLPIEIMDGVTFSQAYLIGNNIYYVCTVKGVSPQMVNIDKDDMSELKEEMLGMIRMVFNLFGDTQDYNYIELLNKYGYRFFYKFENEYGTELLRVSFTIDELMNTQPKKRNQLTIPSIMDKYGGTLNSQTQNTNISSSAQKEQEQSASKSQEELDLLLAFQIEILSIKNQLPLKIDDGLEITSYDLQGKSVCITVRIDETFYSTIDKKILRTGIVESYKQNEDKDRLLKMKKYGYYYNVVLVNKGNKKLNQFTIFPSELL